jgi:WD40 repeat protein
MVRDRGWPLGHLLAHPRDVAFSRLVKAAGAEKCARMRTPGGGLAAVTALKALDGASRDCAALCGDDEGWLCTASSAAGSAAGEVRRVAQLHNARINEICLLHHDARICLSAADDGYLSVCHLGERALDSNFSLGGQALSCDSEGHLILGAGAAGVVRMWDVRQGTRVAAEIDIKGSCPEANCARFIPGTTGSIVCVAPRVVNDLLLIYDLRSLNCGEKSYPVSSSTCGQAHAPLLYMEETGSGSSSRTPFWAPKEKQRQLHCGLASSTIAASISERSGPVECLHKGQGRAWVVGDMEGLRRRSATASGSSGSSCTQCAASRGVRSFRFTDEGRLLLTVTDAGDILLRQTCGGKELYRIGSPSRAACTIPVASSDGRHILSGDIDGKLTLWQPYSKVPTAHFPLHRFEVTALDLSASGAVMASAAADGEVVVIVGRG